MTHDEKLQVIRAMKACGGSFVKALAEAWLFADPDNCAKIEAAWPEYIAKYQEIAGEQTAFIAKLRSLTDDRGHIVGYTHIKDFLNEAQERGLARPRRDGAMKMVEDKSPENINLLGKQIPIVGTMYSIWELQGEAKT